MAFGEKESQKIRKDRIGRKEDGIQANQMRKEDGIQRNRVEKEDGEQASRVARINEKEKVKTKAKAGTDTVMTSFHSNGLGLEKAKVQECTTFEKKNGAIPAEASGNPRTIGTTVKIGQVAPGGQTSLDSAKMERTMRPQVMLQLLGVPTRSVNSLSLILIEHPMILMMVGSLC